MLFNGLVIIDFMLLHTIFTVVMGFNTYKLAVTVSMVLQFICLWYLCLCISLLV